MDLYVNNSMNETPFDPSTSDWIIVDHDADSFIFSEGSVNVADGKPIPNEIDLNRAAVQLDDTNPVNIPKYFLADGSDNRLKEIFNAGNKDKQYAFCAVFDNATATEPQLEAWDDTNMNTYNNPALGRGIPSESWFKAICTNYGTPGVDWLGVSLAGSGVNNVLMLNGGNGPLSAAANLYFNFKIVIPGGYVTPALHTPVLVITYTFN